MSIIYRDQNSRIFYVQERYQVDQQSWIRYTNHLGEVYTCTQESFDERFTPQEPQ